MSADDLAPPDTKPPGGEEGINEFDIVNEAVITSYYV